MHATRSVIGPACRPFSLSLQVVHRQRDSLSIGTGSRIDLHTASAEGHTRDMAKAAASDDERTLAAAHEQTVACRRRRFSSSAVAPGLQRYQNATHWASGNTLPQSLVLAAQKRRPYPDWRTPAKVASWGLFFVYLGAVLSSCMYGGVKPLRDPCWGLPAAARVTALVCVFCFPNAAFCMCRGLVSNGDSTDVDEHVRVLYALMFLERAGSEQARGLMRTIKERNALRGTISLRDMQLPDLPPAPGPL